MPKTKIIYDGDMGGDDIWAIAMMCANIEKFDVLGISTVFGNTDVTQATKNICQFLDYIAFANIPVFRGNDRPMQTNRMFGDDAYGEAGIGGVKLPETEKKEENKGAVGWMIEALDASNEKVTIFATGPLTNIAQVISQRPDLIDKMNIIAMGGALNPPGHGTHAGKSGNITEHAEFNFFQDSVAADTVLASGAKVTLLTMDSNQHFSLNAQRMSKIEDISPETGFGENMAQMMRAVEDLDKQKFGSDGPFVHDPCVIAHFLNLGLFTGKHLRLSVEHDEDTSEATRNGKLHAEPGTEDDPLFMDKLTNPDALFDFFKTSLEKLAAQNPNMKPKKEVSMFAFWQHFIPR